MQRVGTVSGRMRFSGEPRSPDAQFAKQICAECPVIEACFRYSLEADVPFGIFGGVDEEQRKRMKPRKAGRSGPVSPGAPLHGTEAGAARHWRRGEKPCGACREGAQRAKRERQARRAQ